MRQSTNVIKTKKSQLGFWWSEENAMRLKIFYKDFVAECTSLSTLRPNFIVINHALPDTLYFLEALKSIGNIKKVFVKPKSINQKAFEEISRQYDTSIAERHYLSDTAEAISLFENASEGKSPVIALDIGGYFAKPLSEIQKSLGHLFLGVVEDTENGHQKYEKEIPFESCVYSVARSPLKYAEDALVGYSVALATENIIRSFGDLHCSKQVVIIGYGKIGKNAALALKAKNLNVSIYDYNPIKLIQASADGFSVYDNLRSSLARSDIIISSTGNASIKGKDFLNIKNGAYLASVTSSDDELDFNGTASLYTKKSVGDHIKLYKSAKNNFYLLNDGNAINFIYGPSAGAYITLVHAEILACIKALVERRSCGIQEVAQEVRTRIAKNWLKLFAV